MSLMGKKLLAINVIFICIYLHLTSSVCCRLSNIDSSKKCPILKLHIGPN